MIALYVAKNDDEYGTYCKVVQFKGVKDSIFRSRIPFRVTESAETNGVTSIVVNTDCQYLDHRERAANKFPNEDANHYFLVFIGLLYSLVGQCGFSDDQEVYVFAHMGSNLRSMSQFEREAQNQMQDIPQLTKWHFAVLRKGGGDQRAKLFNLDQVKICETVEAVKNLYRHLTADKNNGGGHDQ